MDDLDLCVGPDTYLVGFCCLHTLQLTLSNALNKIIGKGGLEARNAMQAIHSFYDMQQAMEFGLWQKEWKRAAVALGQPRLAIAKIAAPILTRWWTVGEAAKCIVKYLPIFLNMARTFRNANVANTKLNKIASGIISLTKEHIIVSDIKLISSFHDTFLNQHFDWLQKGDEGIGGTPGYLGRHMLLRYFLMHSDLKKMTNDGWKQEGATGMEPFLNSLDEELMDVSMLDPADPKGERTIKGKDIQAMKASKFFSTALKILEKHYSIFCKRLLFLSLYGERCSSQTVAKVLLSQEDFDGVKIRSNFHGKYIDVYTFAQFVKANVNIQEQINNNNVHIHKLKGYLHHLAGTYKIDALNTTYLFQFFNFSLSYLPLFHPLITLYSWQNCKPRQRTSRSLAALQDGVCSIPNYYPFC